MAALGPRAEFIPKRLTGCAAELWPGAFQDFPRHVRGGLGPLTARFGATAKPLADGVPSGPGLACCTQQESAAPSASRPCRAPVRSGAAHASVTMQMKPRNLTKLYTLRGVSKNAAFGPLAAYKR